MKNDIFNLKKGQDLENRAAHPPPPRIRRSTPPPPGCEAVSLARVTLLVEARKSCKRMKPKNNVNIKAHANKECVFKPKVNWDNHPCLKRTRVMDVGFVWKGFPSELRKKVD